MINFNKNKLINNVLIEYYNTFAHTRDTAEYVPDSFNDKILKYIFKNLKKQFKKIDKEDKQYQRELKKRLRTKEKTKANNCKNKKKKTKINIFKRLFYMIFKRKKK